MIERFKMEDDTLEKPFSEAISAVEDPDHGLSDEERAAIVSSSPPRLSHH